MRKWNQKTRFQLALMPCFIFGVAFVILFFYFVHIFSSVKYFRGFMSTAFVRVFFYRLKKRSTKNRKEQKLS